MEWTLGCGAVGVVCCVSLPVSIYLARIVIYNNKPKVEERRGRKEKVEKKAIVGYQCIDNDSCNNKLLVNLTAIYAYKGLWVAIWVFFFWFAPKW